MTINTEQVRWASDDRVDPVTGAPNKVEPTLGIKEAGLNRDEPLARAYLNYQFSKYHEMLEDLQSQINSLAIDAGTGLLQQIYHVGSYYISASNTSPSERLGFGTWTRVRGRFIVGVDENSGAGFSTPLATGGAVSHTHAHTLTTMSAGLHSHNIVGQRGVPMGGSAEPVLVDASGTDANGSHTHTIQGGIEPFSNLPPFEAAFIWRRTA